MRRALSVCSLLLCAGCAAPATTGDVEPAAAPAGTLSVSGSVTAGAPVAAPATPSARAPRPGPWAAGFGDGPAPEAAPAGKPTGWVATKSDEPRPPVAFRRAGYDVVRTRCGAAAIQRYEVDWRRAEDGSWFRGGGLTKDPFSLRRDPRLPPRPEPKSKPRVDEHGQPTGSLVPLR